MAQSLEQRTCNRGAFRLVMVFVGVFLVASIVSPQLFWRPREISGAQASCPSCDCDCSAESDLSRPFGLINSSYADCGKQDPEMDKEMQKNIVALLSDELALQKAVASETLQHTKAVTMDAKRASSHYQKEAEKCNVGMETCEGARERAERELVEERRLTALWEKRAREYGWKDNRRVYT